MSAKRKPDRKDEAKLLSCGIVGAAAGWAYWHYLGPHWGVIGFMLLVLSWLIWPARRKRRDK